MQNEHVMSSEEALYFLAELLERRVQFAVLPASDGGWDIAHPASRGESITLEEQPA